MNPPVVQPALFDEQQTPTGDCPICCRPDGSPNGKWPREIGLTTGHWPYDYMPVTVQCPNCEGTRKAEVPF